ncbi:hypothetical protein K491DRAFT_592760 [Lophiostoma macrostomum CBS 122681]|uniref:Nascent polypeptide-associated complex subunit alpha-like UBA domain-containing protein n=1 Tax=Lophiostoma macrostomum CBS 122681 TaxID=1314788 RepID=A0A6A6TGJ4_9PLEO|nr:hypothetical protein K491DRAFT_592760 [Lophiostoma macrostomum CBS 122681]
MAEPQPSSVHEGAADPHAPSSTAEDRKAAAALSALDAQDDAGDSSKKEVDAKALGEAMKNLAGKDGESEKKKVVKVDAGDVGLLVQELDLTKPKATDLLRAHDGDAVKALTAYVSASA